MQIVISRGTKIGRPFRIRGTGKADPSLTAAAEREIFPPVPWQRKVGNSMSTEAQRTALSSGPRTEAGKAVPRYDTVNAWIRLGSEALSWEDAASLENCHAMWEACLQPRDDAEAFLVYEHASNSWRLQRSKMIEHACLTNQIEAARVREEEEVRRLIRALQDDRRGPSGLYGLRRLCRG